MENSLLTERKVITLAHCGAFRCKKMVEVDASKPAPVQYLCSSCVERFEKGIVEWLKLNTGKTKGGYHITDGYTY